MKLKKYGRHAVTDDGERCCSVRPCWYDDWVDCECLFREHAIIYRSETKAWPPTVGAKHVISRRLHAAVGSSIPPWCCRRALSRGGRPRRRSAASRHEVAPVLCVRILTPSSHYRRGLYPVRRALTPTTCVVAAVEAAVRSSVV